LHCHLSIQYNKALEEVVYYFTKEGSFYPINKEGRRENVKTGSRVERKQKEDKPNPFLLAG